MFALNMRWLSCDVQGNAGKNTKQKKASRMSGYVSRMSVNNCSIRVVSRVNYSQKQVGAKNWERPNRDIKFSKS